MIFRALILYHIFYYTDSKANDIITPSMRNRKGYTFLEVITVVFIIGLLATIAIVNFLKAKKAANKTICIANLKQIQSVIQTWAIDAGAASDATVSTTDIVPNYIKVWPKEFGVDYPVPPNIKAVPVCPSVTVNPDHTL